MGGLPESLASVCGCECGETGGGEWPSSRPEKALGQADGTHLRRTFCLGMTGVQVANWTHSFSSGQGVLTSFPSSLLNSNLLESPFSPSLSWHGLQVELSILCVPSVSSDEPRQRSAPYPAAAMSLSALCPLPSPFWALFISVQCLCYLKTGFPSWWNWSQC